MKRILFASVLILVWRAPGIAGDHDNRPADEAAIRTLIGRMIDAWGQGDGDAFAAVFEPDADYVSFGGMHMEGRDTIAQMHQHLFKGSLSGTHLELNLSKLRFLGPEVALALLEGGFIDAGQVALSDPRRTLQTAVFHKRNGIWRIAAVQVTRSQSAPTPANPRD